MTGNGPVFADKSVDPMNNPSCPIVIVWSTPDGTWASVQVYTCHEYLQIPNAFWHETWGSLDASVASRHWFVLTPSVPFAGVNRDSEN